MRLLAEHPAADRVAAGLEAVPFNCFGFGLFPPGRVGDPDSPCLSLWYDDPHPLYWVQVRRKWDRDILTCEQPFSPEEAWAAAAAGVPLLLAQAARAVGQRGAGADRVAGADQPHHQFRWQAGVTKARRTRRYSRRPPPSRFLGLQAERFVVRKVRA